MAFTPEAQDVINRLERATQTYGEVWNEKEVTKAMQDYYRELGVTMPKVFCADDMVIGYKECTGAAWDAALDAAWGAAWDAARGAARGAAWDAARDAARGAAWDAAWGAAAANNIDIPECRKLVAIERNLLRALENGLGFFFPMQDKLILVPVPKLRLNEQKMLHSDRSPAVEWKTDAYFFLNGVKFPKQLWEDVTSHVMPFEKILAIEDIDQRTQAMKYGNVWDFVKHVNGELLDKCAKERRDGTQVKYWLYKIPHGDLFREDAFYVIYDDLVPGSTKQYMSGVEPCKTVAEAMAWKFSDDLYTLAPDEWEKLEAGVHMN